MDIDGWRALVRDVTFDAFPIPAIVTPPGESPITTTAVWLPSLVEDMPVGRDFNRREPRRVMALRRDEVPDVPRGTVIVAVGEIGGDARNWQIDSIESTEPGHHRVIVIPETS
jgi:hypothetical protein